MVNRGSLALAEVITGQNGYDVRVLSVDHHGNACVLCIHHGTQYGFIITVKCGALVCHKKFQCGHAHLWQMPDFLKYRFLWVHDDCMECKVHRGSVFCLGCLPPYGVQKRYVLFLGGKVHNGGGAACCCRFRCLEEASAKGTVVDMFIHSSRHYVFPGSVNGPAGVYTQIRSNLADGLTLDIDITCKFTGGGQNGSIFY